MKKAWLKNNLAWLKKSDQKISRCLPFIAVTRHWFWLLKDYFWPLIRGRALGLKGNWLEYHLRRESRRIWNIKDILIDRRYVFYIIFLLTKIIFLRQFFQLLFRPIMDSITKLSTTRLQELSNVIYRMLIVAFKHRLAD